MVSSTCLRMSWRNTLSTQLRAACLTMMEHLAKKHWWPASRSRATQRRGGLDARATTRSDSDGESALAHAGCPFQGSVPLRALEGHHAALRRLRVVVRLSTV